MITIFRPILLIFRSRRALRNALFRKLTSSSIIPLAFLIVPQHVSETKITKIIGANGTYDRLKPNAGPAGSNPTNANNQLTETLEREMVNGKQEQMEKIHERMLDNRERGFVGSVNGATFEGFSGLIRGAKKLRYIFTEGDRVHA